MTTHINMHLSHEPVTVRAGLVGDGGHVTIECGFDGVSLYDDLDALEQLAHDIQEQVARLRVQLLEAIEEEAVESQPPF